MAEHRYFYKSAETIELFYGSTWHHEGSLPSPRSFICCPYCQNRLVQLEPEALNLGPEKSVVEPTFCSNCGWWAVYSTYDDESHVWATRSQSLAELVRYDISGLEIPTNLLIDYIAHHGDDVYTVHPRKIEMIVESIFKEHLNCRVELTKATRDGGKDLICFDADDSKFIVEVKRYGRDSRIGIGIIQRFAGVMLTENVSKGVVVTTSSFTKDARVAAERIVADSKDIISLSLNDEADLLSWLKALRSEHMTDAERISALRRHVSLPHRGELPASLIKAVCSI